MLARRDATGVRLFTRNGHDWSYRFPLIRAAMEALRMRSCLIDGEAIAFMADGLASFEMLCGWRHDKLVTLVAFDLVELDGRDLQREPLERRKALLAQLQHKSLPGLVLNVTFEEPGDVVFKHACALGCEGIVSKRLGSRYRSANAAQIAKSRGLTRRQMMQKAAQHLDTMRSEWFTGEAPEYCV
jgi:bifunctional non-homologous end joining protein LigD